MATGAEHLHALSQELACHDFLEKQIAECDQAIAQALERLPVLEQKTATPSKSLRSPHRTNDEQLILHRALNKIMGVDLTAIPTLGVDTVLVLASELGRMAAGPG